MNSLVVFVTYAGAFVFALLLLYGLRNVSWSWHLLSLVAALGIGLMPPLEGMAGPVYDLVVGATFLVLFVWGVGAPLFHHHGHQVAH